MPKAKDKRDQEPGSTGGPGSPGGKSATQIPPGDLSDAVGTHKESEFDADAGRRASSTEE